jgi:YD repeat-containing protein
VALPTFEPVVDAYGVDRKTGKYSMKPQTIISIGGENGLSLTYSDSGGSSLISNYFRKIYWLSTIDGPNVYVTIQYGGVSETFFRDVSTNTFTSEYKTGSSLDQTLGYLRYIDRLGVEIHFQSDRTRVVYPDGREVTSFGVDESPTAVVDNLGNMLKLSGGGTSIHAQAVNRSVDYCDPLGTSPCTGLAAQRSASSVIATSTGLRTLTDAAGGATVYRMYWNDSPSVEANCTVILGSVGCDPAQAGFQYYLYGITFPGSATENITIDYGPGPWPTQDFVRVRSVTINGDRVDYSSYNEGINVPPEAPYRPYLLHVDASINGQNLYRSMALVNNGGFGNTMRTMAYLRDTQNRFINFGSNAAGEIASAQYPEGNTLGGTYSTDGRNNLLTTFNGNLAYTRSYPASCTSTTRRSCNLPLTITDPNGGVTDFTYNARGQVLTETQPAPTSGAVRPKITNTYTERTAIIRDASGSLVAAGPSISLLTKSSTCRTQSTCAGTTDEIVTDYDYGPTTGINTLLLRGVAVTAVNAAGQMETRRTCYTYNYFGERVSETAPAANLASCS